MRPWFCRIFFDRPPNCAPLAAVNRKIKSMTLERLVGVFVINEDVVPR